MLRISVEDAASQLKVLLEQVARGEEVILVEQDREVALTVQPFREQWLTQARQFRESLQVQGESLSATVIRTRQEERG